ncbi:PI-PLC X domain-containing protein [Platanthera guangdongensis]|uniref:PI-PLC X domain-containing protein n=1 Tax=Platanthera guangdongensis TaxID=2320717 RepID=A0ABR2N5F4_9ASPA
MPGLLFLQLLLSILLRLTIFSNAAKVGDGCLADRDCGAGLHCDACGSRCSRITPIDPKTIGKELPFNKYSWLTTHNSYALAGAKSATGSDLITFTNQQDTVTSQLKNGVRGLMLDMYDFEGDIWLCHSFGGSCYNFTAFQPAINVLKEIQVFLQANPAEVITIFIEDYVRSSLGLTKVFSASGLSKYLFPLSKMPKNGADWPLLSDMISKNYRLLVFTSIKSKEASEGIAYEWNYVVENQYGDDGMKAGSCLSREESSPLNTYSKSLVLMNYFPSDPNSTAACAENSAPLLSMLDTCHNLSGNRWPNFIAVDFYKTSILRGIALGLTCPRHTSRQRSRIVISPTSSSFLALDAYKRQRLMSGMQTLKNHFLEFIFLNICSSTLSRLVTQDENIVGFLRLGGGGIQEPLTRNGLVGSWEAQEGVLAAWGLAGRRVWGLDDEFSLESRSVVTSVKVKVTVVT